MAHLFHSAPQRNRYYTWFSALHTRVDLLLCAPLSEAHFEQAEAAIQDCLAAVEQMGNRFNPLSELSQAVCLASLQPAPLSPALFSLLARCLQAHSATNGLFDITVCSPHYTPGLIHFVELIPSAPAASTSTCGGYLRLHRPYILLDLSGILKGYALERLRQLLPSLHIHDALINLGNSSILSLGNNPSDIPSGHCLTTSGNSTSQRQHILNPLTGHYITGQRQVTVTTADAIDGEILSTVQFIQQDQPFSE